MKRGIIAAAAAAMLLSGCAKQATIEGKEYQPYGLFTQDDADPTVRYHVSAGSVILGIVLFETVVVPVYVVGWDLWEPVGKKEKGGQVISAS